MDEDILNDLKVLKLTEAVAYINSPKDLKVYKLTGRARKLEEQFVEALDKPEMLWITGKNLNFIIKDLDN